MIIVFGPHFLQAVQLSKILIRAFGCSHLNGVGDFLEPFTSSPMLSKPILHFLVDLEMAVVESPFVVINYKWVLTWIPQVED